MINWLFFTSDDAIIEKSLPLHSHLGFGVFETIRLRYVNNSWKVIALDIHLERFAKSIRELCLFDIGREMILSIIKERASNLDQKSDQLLRLVSYSDSFGISITPWTPRFNIHEGISLKTYQAQRPFPEHKHCSTIISTYYSQKAKDEGFDEALLYDKDGVITECAWANFFWINSTGVICTSGSTLLPGVTRKIFMEQMGHSVVIENVSLNLLNEIHGALITHATHGFVPVQQINQLKIQPPKGLAKFTERYEALLAPL